MLPLMIMLYTGCYHHSIYVSTHLNTHFFYLVDCSALIVHGFIAHIYFLQQ